MKIITSLDIVKNGNGPGLRNSHIRADFVLLVLEQNHKLGHLEQMASQKFLLYLGGNFIFLNSYKFSFLRVVKEVLYQS